MRRPPCRDVLEACRKLNGTQAARGCSRLVFEMFGALLLEQAITPACNMSSLNGAATFSLVHRSLSSSHVFPLSHLSFSRSSTSMALLENRFMPLPSIVVITLATCHGEEFGCLFVSLMHLRRSTMACNHLLHVHDVAGQLNSIWVRWNFASLCLVWSCSQ